MNRKILEKAVEKASQNGYSLGVATLYELSSEQIIFDHDFVKAFWGEPYWKMHLMIMTLETEPLKYLEKFL